MDCKSPELWAEWLRPYELEDNAAAIQLLKRVVADLDRFSRDFDGKDIVLTCFRREPGDKPSYHEVGQAVDIRIKDRSETFRRAAIMFVIAHNILDSRIQIDPHEDLHRSTDPEIHKHDHLHIEIDTNAFANDPRKRR